MSSNVSWCFVVVVCVEHLSSIRLRSLQRKLIFDLVGTDDWSCTINCFHQIMSQLDGLLSMKMLYSEDSSVKATNHV